MMKHHQSFPMIIHDHVFTDFICNLRCTYCPCEVNLMKRGGDFLHVSSFGDSTAYRESITNFLDRNREVIKRSKNRIDIPVLKISGGEIFLIPEFMDLLPALVNEYAIVQILTNGTLLNPVIIKKLKIFSNIHIQISLDGHTIEMNAQRFRNPKTLSSILRNLTLLSNVGIPLEINCVLTRFNIERFFDFVLDFSLRFRQCTMYPFPVRSHPELFPHPDQIKLFEQALENNFLLVKHILPPIQYFHSLIEFMKAGKRMKRCYIPHTILATSGDGLLEACTCGPVKTLGNVLLPNADDVYSRVGQDSCYDNVKEPDLSPTCCRDCFTHYEIINLFLEGDLSVEELKAMPFFDVPEVLHKLSEKKKELELLV